MQYKISHKAMLLLLCAIPMACNKTDLQREPDPQGKEPIVLSIGGVDTQSDTKAVITDGTNKTMQNFDVNTKIFMVIKSEKEIDGGGNVVPHDGYEYNGDRANTLFTVTRGEVVAGSSDVTFDTDAQKRFWDDAHARSSQLTIWAYAQKGRSTWNNCTFEIPNQGGSGIDAYKDKTWITTELPTPTVWTETEVYPAIRHWRASSHASDDIQDELTVSDQDLLFSNNIADYTAVSKGDRRLKFDFITHKFPRATDVWESTSIKKTEMKFYHAMSKITIHIKKGEGFTGADPFAFTTGNVALFGFNKHGLFNIKTGQFEYIWTKKPTTYTVEDPYPYDIPQIYKWATPAPGDAYTLEALVIPNIDGNTAFQDKYSRFNNDDATKAMEFIIDNNKYEISQDQLYDAIAAVPANSSLVAGDKVDLEAGYNYIFTFTVGKQKINNITAQVADWETVTADNVTPSNARIKLQLEERGSALTSSDEFALYRAADNIADEEPINDNYEVYNWITGYNTTGETPSYVAAVSPNPAHWTTSWYWDSNKHFYHFRALAKDNGSAKVAVTPVSTDSGDGDFYALASAVSYNDILWGAPMLDDADNVAAGSFKWHYGPETNGFDAKDDGTVATGNTGHQIYKAIGSTEDPVKLILFHMMSDLTINITTTTGDDKVNLGDGSSSLTHVYIEDAYANGKILLGNGLVKTTDPVSTSQEVAQNSFTAAVVSPATPASAVYKFGIVPQNLATSVNSGKGVQLRVVTPDNNQYIINLKDVKASTINTNNIQNPYSQVGGDGADKNKYKIDRWYPGFQYTYNLTLKKSQIYNIEATIIAWETVETDNEDVTIQ